MNGTAILVTVSILMLPAIMATVVFGSVLDQFSSKYSFRILTVSFTVLVLAFISNSGLLEETFLLVTRENLQSSLLLGSTFIVSVSAAVIFCSFVAAGVILILIAIFELSLSLVLSPQSGNFYSLSKVLRPYGIVILTSMTINLFGTMFMDRLQPLSILRLVGL